MQNKDNKPVADVKDDNNKSNKGYSAQETTPDKNQMLDKLDTMFASGSTPSRTKVTLRKQRNMPSVAGDQSSPIAMPSPLTMGAKAVLHTHLAVNLFRGRKGDRSKQIREIIGMAVFAKKAGLIWSAARDDDPYADQALVDLEKVVNNEKVLLEEREKLLSEMLDGVEGLDVENVSSTNPTEIPINFHSPWSYRGLLLLLQYDKIVRLGLTAHHVGFIGDTEWKEIITDCGRAVRHVFDQVNRWVTTNVTREDVRKNTKVAQRALAQHMEVKFNRIELTPEVVEGEVRASVAPRSIALEQYIAAKAHKKQQKEAAKAEKQQQKEITSTEAK